MMRIILGTGYQKECTAVIPSRSNRIEPIEYDKDIYKERHVIECFFEKIKHFRRVFSRFDKSIRNFASFLSFVGACHMVTLKTQQNLAYQPGMRIFSYV